MRPLDGKAAIITGGNQGLGLVMARKYVEAGIAHLTLCARDETQLRRAGEELKALARPGQRLMVRAADVSRREEVDALVRDSVRESGHIDVLVNNAGVYGPKGTIDEVDWDEWVRAMEINLFGSILMCRAVLPYYRKQRSGKIIQLSGGGATNPLPRLSAYAASKAAAVRFIETLAEELKGHGIEANAIAPGALNTRMLDEILDAGPDKVGRAFYDRAIQQKESGGASLERAADLAVFLGSSLSDGITGKLISAAWDPWPTLSDHLAELAATDIYTLRRIVPSDRKKDWGNPQ